MRSGTVSIICAWLAAACAGYGQDPRGALLGRVVDSSGAIVIAAQVKAVNTTTNTLVSSLTNQDGNFEMPYLLPGVYRVTAEKQGFRTAVRDGIELRVSDRLTLDFILQPGNIVETVVVKGETPLLESANASVGVVVDEKRISELPVMGGNAFHMTNLAPGVVTTGPRNDGQNPFDWGPGAVMAVNGTSSHTIETTADGVSNMSRSNTAFSVPQDLIQEFKVQTVTYDAGLGHAAGAVVNVSMKSGTNSLHGTTYFTDQRIAALDWFLDKWLYDPTTGPITPEKAEQVKTDRLHERWGATASGPLILPRLFDGRNRAFWSFGYEGVRELDPKGFISTVPTPAAKQGDFSALLNLGAQYQIYDPATIAPAPQGRFSRLPLAGNKLPASRLSPIGQKIVSFWPDANSPGTPDGHQNYVFAGGTDRHYHSVVGRLDQNFSEKHRTFVRINESLFDQNTNSMKSVAAADNTQHRPTYGFALDNVYVFNPRLLLNVRYGLTFLRAQFFPKTHGFDLLSLGFPASLMQEIASKADPAGLSFPQIVTDGYTNIGTNGGYAYATNYHSLVSTLTRITGNHSTRFGVEFRLMRETGYNFGYVAPRLQFASTWTKGPLDNAPAAPIGQGLASLLLGLPSAGQINVNASYAQQSTFTAFYVQDDWKITRRLTLNFGLRYEYEGPTTERYNRSIRGFDFQTPSPIQAQAQANYAKAPIPELPAAQFRTMGGLMFPGVGGQPRALWTTDKNNFAPRVGLAFQLARRTVIRAGYGIFYDLLGIDHGGWQINRNINQGGFNQTTNLIPSTDNGLTFTGTLGNPFPNGLLVPAGAAGGLITNLGNAATYFDSKPENPYMQRWSFSVQHELPARVLLDATYVGNRGNKLAASRELSPTPRQYLSTSPVRDQATINFLTQQLPSPFYGISQFAGTTRGNQTISRAALLTPYPQFTSIVVDQSIGYSYYHALQVRAEKRFQRGLTFNVGWSWSKFMNASNFLNDTDPAPEKVISNMDFPHRLTVSSIYELPFGRAKPMFRNASGWLNQVIGGWQMQGTYEAQAGQALGFGNAIFFGNLHDIPLPVDQRKVERWFNIDAGFERASNKQLGSNIQAFSSRFSGVRGDGINAFDLSVFKNWPVKEHMKLQFRAEAYNALNHPMFGNPNTNPANQAFGTIIAAKNGSRVVTFGLKLYF